MSENYSDQFRYLEICLKIIVINSDSFVIPWKYVWKLYCSNWSIQIVLWYLENTFEACLKISDVHQCISDVLEKRWNSSWVFKICLIFSNVQIVSKNFRCIWNSSWAFKICLIFSMFRMLDFSWKHFQQFLNTILMIYMSKEKMMSSLLCVRMRAVWTCHVHVVSVAVHESCLFGWVRY